MTSFRIASKSGSDYGIYDGVTPEAAFAAMVADGGGEIGAPEVGTADDWVIVPVVEYVVEGRGERGDWSREYVEAGGEAVFATQTEADAALDDLAVRLNWNRDDLRVREIR